MTGETVARHRPTSQAGQGEHWAGRDIASGRMVGNTYGGRNPRGTPDGLYEWSVIRPYHRRHA
jgi:hypothetical protein